MNTWHKETVLIALALVTACGGGSSTNSSVAQGTATITGAGNTASGSSSNSTISDANSCVLPNFSNDLLVLVNNARAAERTCGSQIFAATTPLTWNDKLHNAAAAHSQDMVQNNFFDHKSADGTTFDKRITNAGYNMGWGGENIAAGQRTVNSVMQSWLQSPGHCANIMNVNFKEIGVACVKGTTSNTYSHYWTMDLASPQ